MTIDQARGIVGNRPQWELQAMARALALHSWLNTPEERARLQAARIMIRASRGTA